MRSEDRSHPEPRPVAQEAAARWLCRVCAGERALPGEHVAGPDALRLATAHRLAERAGSMLAVMREGGASLPAWCDALVSAWRRGVGEEALWSGLLERCGSEAARRGLPVVVLKGADLARRVYGPGERSHNDLDLLVPAERLAEADGMLRASGLVPDHPEARVAAKFWFATTYRDASRPRRQVDLHWALGPRGRVAWDCREVIARSRAHASLYGLRRLDIVDAIVHLALHAVAFHGAAGRWIWWLDLCLAAERAHGRLDELVARAGEAGGSIALRAALARAGRLFGPVPGLPAATTACSRSRLITRIGPLAERSAGRRSAHSFGRLVVAALAVDRPASLRTVLWDVARREWWRRTGQWSQERA